MEIDRFETKRLWKLMASGRRGPLFDISVMHVVTGCVIRDRVWIIRRQRATSGIRNGSRVPRDLQGHPARLTPPPLSLPSFHFYSAGNARRLNRGAKRRFRRASRTNKADSRNWYALPDDMSRVNLRRDGSCREIIRDDSARPISFWKVCPTPRKIDQWSKERRRKRNIVKIPQPKVWNTKFSKLKRRMFKVASQLWKGEKFE